MRYPCSGYRLWTSGRLYTACGRLDACIPPVDVWTLVYRLWTSGRLYTASGRLDACIPPLDVWTLVYRLSTSGRLDACVQLLDVWTLDGVLNASKFQNLRISEPYVTVSIMCGICLRRGPCLIGRCSCKVIDLRRSCARTNFSVHAISAAKSFNKSACISA